MTVQLRSRRDALIWSAVDAIFGGADARTIIGELELDLIRERADRHLTRIDLLVQLMRETDPDRISATKAAA
jgi:hypothetical protein